MVDLDAPNGTAHNYYAPFLHWLSWIKNDQETLIPANASEPSDFAPYFGPAPPPGTGLHRYVVLLFTSQSSDWKTPKDFSKFNGSAIEDRIKFRINAFVEEAELSLAAANWCKVGYSQSNAPSPTPTGAVVSSDGTSTASFYSLSLFFLLLFTVGFS